MQKNTLSPEEIATLAPPSGKSLPEWIEANRVLTVASSAEPGPKSMARTPFLSPILEAWQDDHVREIVVQKSAQIGMTDLAVDLCIHTAADDPCPMAVFLADQATAEQISTERIQPALLGCKTLEGMIDSSRMTRLETSLRNGFNLIVGWASSIALTASRPIKKIVADEVNKPGYQAVGEEGATIGRLKERQETFPDSKFLMLSTPTLDTGTISRAMESCEVVYDWCPPCPFCGAHQPLRLFPAEIAGKKTGSVVWEGGSSATPEQIQATARYQCSDCGELWTTQQKNEAVLRGAAIPRTPPPKHPRRVGFHLNRLISLFPGGRLDSMVMSWLDARKDIAEMQNFYNSTLGEPWVQRVSASQDDATAAVLRCKTELPRGVVPDAADALVCFCDVQQAGVWWRVRAFSRDLTSWGVDEGIAGTWEDLEDILFEREWLRQDGTAARMWRAMLDTGGGKASDAAVSRTEETYLFIRRNNRRNGVALYGSKGSSYALAGKMKIGKPIEKTPSGKPLAGGVQVVMLNTGLLKEALWWRIENTVNGGPGAWHLHADTEQWVARQITAEEKRKDKRGAIEWHQLRPDNHLLDCEVGCLALADPEFFGGIRAFAKALEYRKAQQTKPATAPADASNPFTRKPIATNPYTRR